VPDLSGPVWPNGATELNSFILTASWHESRLVYSQSSLKREKYSLSQGVSTPDIYMGKCWDSRLPQRGVSRCNSLNPKPHVLGNQGSN
jgi:hypothetical protein